ncbi:MAG: thiamine phosphate synthase [Acidobacteriota bacterium]
MPIFNTILKKLDLELPLFYGISDRRYFSELDPFRYLDLLFQTSAHILQWREKDLGPGETRVFAERGAQLAGSAGKLFLINSHVEIALQSGAGGTHLTSDQNISQAVERRNRSGAGEFILGKSVHSVAAAKAAQEEGADYVLLGPIFSPLSKKAGRRPLGLDGLREAAQALRIPVFALGGIDGANFQQIFQAGASGAAGITWLREEVRKRSLWA